MAELEFCLEGPGDGHYNMATDAANLDRVQAEGCIGRVYQWNGLWVSLGRFQTPDAALLTPEHTNWVMRPSGGKAVIHGSDLTASIAVGLGRLQLEPRAVRSIYRRMIAPIVSALRASGVRAALAETTVFSGRGQTSADCFAFNSPNDIVDETTGRKLCGCALHVIDRAALLQASIPIGPALANPSDVVVGGVEREFEPWNSGQFASHFETALVDLL